MTKTAFIHAGLVVFGIDQNNRDLPPLHFSGHLAPGAGQAEERVQAVMTHVSSDAVALPHRHPHGHRDGRNKAEHVQQGETQALAILLSGYTGKAGTAPISQTTFWHVLGAITDPGAPFF